MIVYTTVTENLAKYFKGLLSGSLGSGSIEFYKTEQQALQFAGPADQFVIGIDVPDDALHDDSSYGLCECYTVLADLFPNSWGMTVKPIVELGSAPHLIYNKKEILS